MLELQVRTRISELSWWFFDDYSLRECFARQHILSGQRCFQGPFWSSLQTLIILMNAAKMGTVNKFYFSVGMPMVIISDTMKICNVNCRSGLQQKERKTLKRLPATPFPLGRGKSSCDWRLRWSVLWFGCAALLCASVVICYQYTQGLISYRNHRTNLGRSHHLDDPYNFWVPGLPHNCHGHYRDSTVVPDHINMYEWEWSDLTL